MRKMIFAVAFALVTVPATASDRSDVIKTIVQYNSNFAATLCAPQTVIVDDFPPHVWQGADACSNWSSDLDVYNKKRGITFVSIVALGKPWHVTVTGDRAYAVYPTHYFYKLNRKPVTEQGVWTFALQKLAEGWRITGWTWAQR